MKLIAENIHVISKITKEAFLNRDEEYIKNLMTKLQKQIPTGLISMLDLQKVNLKELLNGLQKYIKK
ncbi:MAG: hypothetical protein L6V95_15385 [Candidatus Melainabacteria bacterium]|nr:MAG: hypothetical protein L6V95_15385 [Candidatus Melainabacteria bacterium]